MLIGLPRLYGAWHMVLTGLLQHVGLADNVIDHRLNTRTVYMNPISRFIYWNMNYHVEHHMFPMVPYHALPRLHELIKHDLPDAEPVDVACLSRDDLAGPAAAAAHTRTISSSANCRRRRRPYRGEFHELDMSAAAE